MDPMQLEVLCIEDNEETEYKQITNSISFIELKNLIKYLYGYIDESWKNPYINNYQYLQNINNIYDEDDILNNSIIINVCESIKKNNILRHDYIYDLSVEYNLSYRNLLRTVKYCKSNIEIDNLVLKIISNYKFFSISIKPSKVFVV